MDDQQVQRTRWLLQARFRRISTAKLGHFEFVCQQVLTWLENHPILGEVLAKLENQETKSKAEIANLILYGEDSSIGAFKYYKIIIGDVELQNDEPQFSGNTASTLEDNAGACLAVLRAVIQKPDLGIYCKLAIFLTREDYSPRTRGKQRDLEEDVLQAIKDIAVRHLFEYLDENLDSVVAINGLLRKYKQFAEWFHKTHLRQIAENGYEGKTGERALALHLQEYVFNQGVDFVVEQSSPSGEADLVLRDASNRHVIIDAKFLKKDQDGSSPSKSKIVNLIAKGFKQVSRYCSDYNQPEGFLAVFVDDDLDIQLDTEKEGGFYYFKVGANVIYYIEINISDRPSASKSGKPNEVYISRDELITAIEAD